MECRNSIVEQEVIHLKKGACHHYFKIIFKGPIDMRKNNGWLTLLFVTAGKTVLLNWISVGTKIDTDLEASMSGDDTLFTTLFEYTDRRPLPKPEIVHFCIQLNSDHRALSHRGPWNNLMVVDVRSINCIS